MASGSYAKKKAVSRELAPTTIPLRARATQKLPELPEIEEMDEPEEVEEVEEVVTDSPFAKLTKVLQTGLLQPVEEPGNLSWKSLVTTEVVDEYAPHPLERHRSWLNPLLISLVCIILGAGVLLAAAVMQRPEQPGFVSFLGGQVYSMQVGGSLAKTWQSNTPLPPKVPIPTHTGPYSVLGKPTITVNFINQVLASYNSPAAGKGQALYDLGVQYGIDPAFALAFFMHESTFGTAGEARSSLSLGNLRCIPNFECRDNYAWFPTWEAGFKAWYSLIRNLYVADWGLTTVDQIIPRYAPPSDNNNDSAYIASLKHAIDTWHAGILRP